MDGIYLHFLNTNYSVFCAVKVAAVALQRDLPAYLPTCLFAYLPVTESIDCLWQNRICLSVTESVSTLWQNVSSFCLSMTEYMIECLWQNLSACLWRIIMSVCLWHNLYVCLWQILLSVWHNLSVYDRQNLCLSIIDSDRVCLSVCPRFYFACLCLKRRNLQCK